MSDDYKGALLTADMVNTAAGHAIAQVGDPITPELVALVTQPGYAVTYWRDRALKAEAQLKELTA